MKLIYSNENRAIVYSVKNILEINNIDSQIKNEYGHSMGAEFGISNSMLELWLSNDQNFDKAQALIESEINMPKDMSPWVCSECGEENEGNFQLCWKCQNEFPEPS